MIMFVHPLLSLTIGDQMYVEGDVITDLPEDLPVRLDDQRDRWGVVMYLDTETTEGHEYIRFTQLSANLQDALERNGYEKPAQQGHTRQDVFTDEQAHEDDVMEEEGALDAEEEENAEAEEPVQVTPKRRAKRSK